MTRYRLRHKQTSANTPVAIIETDIVLSTRNEWERSSLKGDQWSVTLRGKNQIVAAKLPSVEDLARAMIRPAAIPYVANGRTTHEFGGADGDVWTVCTRVVPRGQWSMVAADFDSRWAFCEDEAAGVVVCTRLIAPGRAEKPINSGGAIEHERIAEDEDDED